MGSRWGCFCELPVDSLLQREQSCPSSLSPALLFSQHLSRTRKTEPARNKVLCSTLAWASKPAKNHTEPSENRRGLTSQRQLRGDETNPRLLSRVSRSPRDLTCSYTGGSLSTAMVSWPRARVTPGGGSGDCRSLTPSAWVRVTCTGSPHTHKAKKKGKNTWELLLCLDFPDSQLVKNLPAMQEIPVRFLGWEDPLEKGKATQSSILTWRITCTV